MLRKSDELPYSSESYWNMLIRIYAQNTTDWNIEIFFSFSLPLPLASFLSSKAGPFIALMNNIILSFLFLQFDVGS